MTKDSTTAMVFGLLLMVFGIGAFCALIYKMAVYALPVMVGLWAAFAALRRPRPHTFSLRQVGSPYIAMYAVSGSRVTWASAHMAWFDCD